MLEIIKVIDLHKIYNYQLKFSVPYFFQWILIFGKSLLKKI